MYVGIHIHVGGIWHHTLNRNLFNSSQVAIVMCKCSIHFGYLAEQVIARGVTIGFCQLCQYNFKHNRLTKASALCLHNRTTFKAYLNVQCTRQNTTIKIQCTYFGIKATCIFYCDYSHFMDARWRYSNRAVIYSNAAFRKFLYALIKQSILKHNIDFWIIDSLSKHCSEV